MAIVKYSSGKVIATVFVRVIWRVREYDQWLRDLITFNRKTAMMTKKKGDGHRYRMVGLRLGDGVRQEVEEMARVERRSLAQMCALLIEKALEARKRKGKS